MFDSTLLTLRLAALIDPEALASLPEGKRLVWVTNNPSEFQTELPQESRQIVADWMVERNQIVQDTLKYFWDANVQREAVAQLQKLLPPIDPQDVHVLLEIQRIRGEIHLYGNLFDGKGKALLCHSYRYFNAEKEDTTTKRKGENSSDVPLVVSPDTALICRQIRAQTDASVKTVHLSADQRARFANLEKFDPLSYAASDVIESYRQNGHSQIVADLPDGMIADADMALAGMDPPSSAKNAVGLVSSGECLQASEVDLVTLLKPVRAAENRENRVDRSNYASLLKDSMDLGCPPLSRLSGYAAHNPTFENTTVDQFCEMLFGHSISNAKGPASWASLRFWASLSEEQLSLLEAGGSIPLSSLTQDQSDLAVEVMFSNESFLGDGRTTSDERHQPDTFVKSDLPEQATEMVAGGFREGFLTCSLSTNPVMLVDCEEVDHGGLIGDADDLAGFLAPTSSDSERSQHAQMGQSKRVELIFHLGKERSRNAVLTDVRIPKGSPLLPLFQLPPDFVAKALAIVKAADDDSSGHDEKPKVSPY